VGTSDPNAQWQYFEIGFLQDIPTTTSSTTATTTTLGSSTSSTPTQPPASRLCSTYVVM